ncbi:Cytochrome c oxidase copper chaperone [Caenorhabditis elegans]|uniref:Cytochrome c oxidase copper chaperone n=1 Tax=Caenorhabditis elegans TaxID=6239 RepID=Q9TZ68_CAEEL|nr:Cytochrome c oxidase copper chaperone [Caenorhabditis elegans]CCD70928.1 Cytochrome c oxidase copper chaperone [Caenorhabditis elegans]|eukprot:NP_497175.1 Cytochrome OXidase assembly protein [Caenorhabditis elegans]
MPAEPQKSTEAGSVAPEKKLKACCACPETKRVRDACIIENGEEKCGKLIEAHKACMRAAGFNI